MNLASRWVDYSISPAQVGIATAQYNGKFLNRVRKAQKAVSSRLSNVMFVDAMGLPIGSDYTHLTTQAQVQLGSMLAKAYLSKQ
jgi:ATP-dependent Clp protease ATP-binding subunit ClpA